MGRLILRIGAESSRIEGLTVDAVLAKMDRAEIEHAFLLAVDLPPSEPAG